MERTVLPVNKLAAVIEGLVIKKLVPVRPDVDMVIITGILTA